MIRITNLRLPFDHQEQDLLTLIQKDLGVDPAQLTSWRILKRSLDARKNKPLLRVYSVLVEAENEADILSSHSKNPRISRIVPEINGKTKKTLKACRVPAPFRKTSQNVSKPIPAGMQNVRPPGSARWRVSGRSIPTNRVRSTAYFQTSKRGSPERIRLDLPRPKRYTVVTIQY